MKKLCFLAILPFLAVSCSSGGGSSFFPDNPFNENNRVSEEEALTILKRWNDELTEKHFLAHLHYEENQLGSELYFEAEYTSEFATEIIELPNEYKLYYFHYKAGSLIPEKSNVNENHVRVQNNGIGRGLWTAIVDLEYNSNSKFEDARYYCDGSTFSYYLKHESKTEQVYIITKFDKNGLISYYDKNENLIDQRAKYRFTYTATYTLVA